MRRIEMPGPCRLVLPETAPVAEWMHVRTSGIGGSEVAALLGQHPFATPFDIYRLKVNEWGKPRFQTPPPRKTRRLRPELLTDEPVFEWGHRLEQAVALKTADELGLVARSGGGLYQHLDHSVALVTPDRVATKKRSMEPVALIECKTSGGAWEDEEAPLQYEIQAQWQMGILGVHTCYLGCFVLDYARDFHLVKIDFDQEYFDELVRVAEQFWTESVLTGTPPMFDLTHRRTEDLLKELHPKVEYERIDLPEEAEEWLLAYEKAKDTVKAAETYLVEIKNWIRMHMGDAAGGYFNGQKVVSYPEVHTRRIVVGTLREKYPEIAEECTEESVHRRMTVRKLKASVQDPN